MPPEKSTTYKCRRGLPQQGMWGVISLTINDLNRLSSSDLPYRQLRNPERSLRPGCPCDLPYRQLRNGRTVHVLDDVGDLPYRQLRNRTRETIGHEIGDLPYRQLRKRRALHT